MRCRADACRPGTEWLRAGHARTGVGTVPRGTDLATRADRAAAVAFAGLVLAEPCAGPGAGLWKQRVEQGTADLPDCMTHVRTSLRCRNVVPRSRPPGRAATQGPTGHCPQPATAAGRRRPRPRPSP